MSTPLSVIDTATLAEMDRYGVSREARWLYVLLPLAGSDEDRTRFCADPDFLCGAFYAADADVTPARVSRWLGELSAAELIRTAGEGDSAEGVVSGRLGSTTRRLEKRARQ